MAEHEKHQQPCTTPATACDTGHRAKEPSLHSLAPNGTGQQDAAEYHGTDQQDTTGCCRTGQQDAAECCPTDQPEWRDALAAAENIAVFARPSTKELHTLACACAEPSQLHLLLEAFARHAAALPQSQMADNLPHTATLPQSKTPDSLPRHAPEHTAAIDLPAGISPSQLPYALLCDFVDDSSHDLREWINALTIFADWLRDNNRQPQPLTMLLPYLACSAEAQANSPMPLPLPHILADMLELYGYDGG